MFYSSIFCIVWWTAMVAFMKTCLLLQGFPWSRKQNSFPFAFLGNAVGERGTLCPRKALCAREKTLCVPCKQQGSCPEKISGTGTFLFSYFSYVYAKRSSIGTFIFLVMNGWKVPFGVPTRTKRSTRAKVFSQRGQAVFHPLNPDTAGAATRPRRGP